LSDQSIFNDGTPAVEPVASPAVSVPPSTSTFSPEVAEYVGAGKKYASVDEAIKSVPHAQKHIDTLKEQLAAATAELEKRRTTESILEELKATGIQSSPQQVASSVTPEDVQKLVQQAIGQNEAQAKATNNINVIKSSFESKFGQQAEQEYIRIANESGLSVADLNRLAASSPNAVLKLAGLGKVNPPISAKPSSTVNTEAFTTQVVDQNLSARVKTGASTKDLLNGWKIAGQKVGKQS